ncbi:hypothetical protein, partial [Mycetocola sp.]|uniref:hypothetical protein n=1 Tax=Mycetocola sp. TaxID=1871042 RepID=UPI002618BFB8
FHSFPTVGASRLSPDRFYLVRPDGFVAAEATGDEAIGVFRGALAEHGVRRARHARVDTVSG